MPGPSIEYHPHENHARKWKAAYSSGRSKYQAFRTLAEARTRPDAVAVFDLADPFEPLATFPARRIEADEPALDRLNADLGAILTLFTAPASPTVEGRVLYETSDVLDHESDSPRLGGVVLHESLRGLGLEPEVESVFLGIQPCLDPRSPRLLLLWDWWEAVEGRDVDRVRGLLDRGVPVGTVRGDGGSALSAAVRKVDLPMTRLLLERGADPNQAERGGWTPVAHSAADVGRTGGADETETLGLLLAAGGRLGLREAVMLGDVDRARGILDADPTIDVSGDAGYWHSYSYLMVAVRFGHLEMVRFLLERGADVHAVDDDLHYTSVGIAASVGRADIAALLLDHGADPDHVSENFTPLATAADRGHADVIRLLLDRGVRRTIEDAVLLNDASLVAELLPTAKAEKRSFDLLLSRCRRHLALCDIAILRLLLHAWAEEDGISLLDEESLREAAGAGRLDAVELLLEHGFDPGKADEDGVTPAGHAERAGHVEIAELLRAAGRNFRPDPSDPFRRRRR